MVVGSPALNQNAFAVLAFGNLTKNDVKLVEFSSYGAMWKGMVNNEVDAAIASTISGQVKEVETSPRGIVYPPTPAADKEGWARLNKVGPYYYPHKATCGAGIPQGGSVELPSYPYPIFMAYASQPADLVYSLTKAMIVNYDAYKDAAPGAAGLALDRQNLAWVIPYHEGAVKALKEAGVWKAEHEAHNQKLLKRQDDAGGGLGRLPQDQSARRQGRVHQGLDGRRAGPRSPRSAWTRSSMIGASSPGRCSCSGPAPAPGAPDVQSPMAGGRTAAAKIEFDDPHAQAGPAEAEVTRVRTARRRVALAADRRDRRDHLPVHQPAVHAALLHRLHAAQHRIFLPADSVHAAVHVPDLSGDGLGAARSRALVRRGAVRRDDRRVRLPDAQRAHGGRARLGVRRRADAGRSSPASSCGRC